MQKEKKTVAVSNQAKLENPCGRHTLYKEVSQAESFANETDKFVQQILIIYCPKMSG